MLIRGGDCSTGRREGGPGAAASRTGHASKQHDDRGSVPLHATSLSVSPPLPPTFLGTPKRQRDGDTKLVSADDVSTCSVCSDESRTASATPVTVCSDSTMGYTRLPDYGTHDMRQQRGHGAEYALRDYGGVGGGGGGGYPMLSSAMGYAAGNDTGGALSHCMCTECCYRQQQQVYAQQHHTATQQHYPQRSLHVQHASQPLHYQMQQAAQAGRESYVVYADAVMNGQLQQQVCGTSHGIAYTDMEQRRYVKRGARITGCTM